MNCALTVCITKHVILFMLTLPIHSCHPSENVEAQELYNPPLRYQNEERKRPDMIQLPGISRKGLLSATSDAATRWGLSSAAHLGMVSSTVNAAGGNMNDFVASLPTSKRHRKSAQTKLAQSIKEDFMVKHKDSKKVLHWDGKITQFLDEQGLVFQDCNAVVLSIPLSDIRPQFIGAPVVEHATGQQLAAAAIHCVDEWDARDTIIAQVFDTTSANTGLHEGAAVHIENILERCLLWLPCRHHIAELHVKHPYDRVQGPTRGTIGLLDTMLFYHFGIEMSISILSINVSYIYQW